MPCNFVNLKMTNEHWIYQIVCALMFLATATSCSKKHEDEKPAAAPPVVVEVVDKSWWLQKSINSLRLGDAPANGTNVEELLKMDSRQVAFKLMEDDAFYNMLTDFTMYWIGTKSTSVRTALLDDSERPVLDNSGKPIVVIDDSVVKSLPSLNAVGVLAGGGDYFAGLFSEKGHAYLSDSEVPYYGDTSATYGLGGASERQKIRATIGERLKSLEAELRPFATVEHKEEFCRRLKAFVEAGDYSLGTLQISSSFFNESEPGLSRSTFSSLKSLCKIADSDDNKEFNFPGIFLTLFMTQFEQDVLHFNRIDDRLDGKHPLAVSYVTQLTKVDWSTERRGTEFQLWNDALFYKVLNSSTNRNRKRASWVLKRFLCDDLTPINVQAPAAHSAEAHGSDPACFSCHYKLDPMAGYFRELGSGGRSYADQENIFFDDGARMSRQIYESPWKTVVGSSREWNIGYIRSTVDEQQNTYGSNFSDLLTMLKTAPEVRECFVKRVFEYVVGENQTYDRSWGRGVASRMDETAKTSPLLAIKGVFAEMTSSRAFSTRERDNNRCYDLPEGVKESERSPCRIAAIIEKNCVSCHSATNKQGDLDLSTWKQFANGAPGFVQMKEGKEVVPSVVFANMFERLGSSDGNLRMPLMKSMPDAERQELYLWLEKNMGQKK